MFEFILLDQHVCSLRLYITTESSICRSLAGELTLSCARPAADGWPLCG